MQSSVVAAAGKLVGTAYRDDHGACATQARSRLGCRCPSASQLRNSAYGGCSRHCCAKRGRSPVAMTPPDVRAPDRAARLAQAGIAPGLSRAPRADSKPQIARARGPTCSCRCGGLSGTITCCSGLLRGLSLASRLSGDLGLGADSKFCADGLGGLGTGCSRALQLSVLWQGVMLPAVSCMAHCAGGWLYEQNFPRGWLDS